MGDKIIINSSYSIKSIQLMICIGLVVSCKSNDDAIVEVDGQQFQGYVEIDISNGDTLFLSNPDRTLRTLGVEIDAINRTIKTLKDHGNPTNYQDGTSKAKLDGKEIPNK